MKTCYPLFLFLLIASVSCISHKKVVLLQGAENGDTVSLTPFTYKIQENDRLIIRVHSYNKEVSNFFNLGETGSTGVTPGNVISPVNTYIVDDSGYVYVPMLDGIKLSGLSLKEAEMLVTEKIKEMVDDSYVILRLAEFKVTVIGETGEQVINFDDDRVHIYEALSTAGFTSYSDRKNLKLVRQENGVAKVVELDATRELLTSPYFYLHPNDILYVKPLRVKTFVDNVGVVSRVIGIASILFLVNTLIKSI